MFNIFRMFSLDKVVAKNDVTLKTKAKIYEIKKGDVLSFHGDSISPTLVIDYKDILVNSQWFCENFKRVGRK